MTFWKTVLACMLAGIINAILINALAILAYVGIVAKYKGFN